MSRSSESTPASSSPAVPPVEVRDAVRPVRAPRTWPRKFRDAARGFRRGVRGESSFFVHFFAAAAVVASAVALQVSLLEWAVLILCITLVLVAEMLNTAIEWLAAAVTREHDRRLGTALDVGSAAVLIAAVGAVVVGLLIFGNRLGVLAGWWK